MLVMLIANAISGRAFSAMKQIEPCLCGMTGENHLNHMILLLIHKELTDSSNLIEARKGFVRPEIV